MLKAVFRDAGIYGLSIILSRVISVFSLPVYTRVMTTQDYGAMDLLITFGALANLVIALEISQGLARYWSETEGLKQQNKLASTAFLFTAFAYLLFLLITLSFSESLSLILLSESSYTNTFELAVLFIFFNGIFSILHNLFRWQLRSKSYGLLAISNSLLTFLFAASLSFGLGMGLSGVLLGYVFANFLSCVIAAWLLRESFGLNFDRTLLLKMLSFSLPLVPAGIATFLMLYANRIALATFTSLEDVAIFGVASKIAGMISVLLAGVRLALTPLIYKHHASPGTPQDIADLFRWFSALSLGICLVISLFSSEIIRLLSTSEYDEAAMLVGLLAPAILLSQIYIFAPGIAILKRTGLQLIVTVISGGLSVLLNWMVVPIFGLLGAAFVTFITALFFLTVWVVISQRLYFVPFYWNGILAVFFSYLVLVYFPYLMVDYQLSVIFKILEIAFFVALILVFRVVRLSELNVLADQFKKKIQRG